jgi:hypothetical protein
MPAPPGEPTPIAGQGYELVFEDDFDTLNRDIWNPPPAHGTDWPSGHVVAASSILTITADQSFTRPYEEVWSLGPRRADYPTYPNYPNAVAWQEGYFECRCRATDNPWTKLALWMFSLEDKNAFNTGQRNCSVVNAEWDMVENGARAGQLPAGSGYANTQHVSNIGRNTNGVCGVLDTFKQYVVEPGGNLCDWHVWSGKWTATRLYTYLDGVLLGSQATFDTTAQPMPFIFLAAPTNWAPSGGEPLPDFIVTEVDWFRVWQSAGAAGGGGIGSGRRSMLSLPGTSGAYATTPSHSSLNVTDIDIRIDLAMADWTPAAFTTFVSRNDTEGQRSFQWGILTSGVMEWRWYTNGTTTFTVQSSQNLSTRVNGERQALRLTFDIDNGASGSTARFYTAPTIKGPWTQFGSDRITAGVTSIHPGIDPIEIGSHDAGTGNLLAGSVHAVEIRNGLVDASPLVAHADFTDKTPGAEEFTDETGKTWVVVAPAIIRPGTPKPDIYTAASPLRLA